MTNFDFCCSNSKPLLWQVVFSILKKQKTCFLDVNVLDEQCQNFLKPNCSCTDIVLYIQLESERLPICKNCWPELAELTEDWNEHMLKGEEKQDIPKQACC
jgi:hypothetical protein